MNILKKLTLLVALGGFSVQAYTMHKAAAAIKSSMAAHPGLLAGALCAKAEEDKFASSVHILARAHQEELLGLPDGFIGRVGSMPHFWIKDGARGKGRVEGAARIQHFIDQRGVTTLAVPEKYAYKVGDREFVVAQAVDVQYIRSFNLQELQDIISLVEATGYRDLNDGNMVRNAQTKKITILDTENRSFGDSSRDLFITFKRSFRSKLDPDATAYFDEYNQRNCQRVYGDESSKYAACVFLGSPLM